MERIAVVDYGMGNLRSVAKALEHVAAEGQDIVVSADREVIGNAERVVFPGQGAIRDCMVELERLGLREPVLHAARHKPFLGICIGLQALLETSEEHRGTEGLGLLRGDVPRFPPGLREPATGERLKIPHMGWNQVWRPRDHWMWRDIEDGARFYFVHSYYVRPDDPTIIAGLTRYGLEFACALTKANLFAVQFHPEKSQHAGLTLLRNFLRWEVA